MGANRDESAFAPVRWGAAGFLGGASVIGMLWAIFGRAPALPPTPAPARVEEARIAERITPRVNPNPARAGANVETRAPDPAAPLAEVGTPAAESDEPAGANPEYATGTPPEPASERPPPTRTPIAGDRLNINAATAAELELLPRIGPTLAARIIEFREREGRIRSLSHLMEVRGIGERTIEQLEPYIRFE